MPTDALPATASVSIVVDAAPESLWQYVSDPSMPARFSNELQEARFEGDTGAVRGAVIEGRNANGDVSWTTHSTVVDCDDPHLFRWATGGVETPAATWWFEVLPTDGGALLTHAVILHADVPPLGPAVQAEPERAHQIVDARLAEVLANMERTIEGIAAIAEGRRPATGDLSAAPPAPSRGAANGYSLAPERDDQPASPTV